MRRSFQQQIFKTTSRVENEGGFEGGIFRCLVFNISHNATSILEFRKYDNALPSVILV